MPARLQPTAAEVAKLRALIEEEKVPQRIAAERMGWTLRRVERLIPRLGLKTQKTGRFSGPEYDPRWKGGVIVDKDGYRLRYCPGHPFGRTHTNYVLEHRLVMEQVLGRYLEPGEVVHHRNGDKQDNRPANLEVFASNPDHLRAELTGRCPKWTPQGQANILASVRRPYSRRRTPAAHDESPQPRTTPPKTA